MVTQRIYMNICVAHGHRQKGGEDLSQGRNFMEGGNVGQKRGTSIILLTITIKGEKAIKK